MIWNDVGDEGLGETEKEERASEVMRHRIRVFELLVLSRYQGAFEEI